MRRDNKEYENISKIIIDIYLDYDIKSFPIDEKEVCGKLGIVLVPYSETDDEMKKLLLKKSKLGSFWKRTKEYKSTIYYNDKINSKGSMRFTIFHEIKHYVFEDESDENDDLADFFARYFMCPIPYLMLKGIHSPNEIVSHCGVSLEAAKYVAENIVNRRKIYGNKIFDYEIKFIEHLDPVLLELI